MMLKMSGKKGRLLIALWLLLTITGMGLGQSVQCSRLQPDVIQARLSQFKGKDTKREATLKKLFEEAGCSTERLNEQHVDHSGAPNVICALPDKPRERPAMTAGAVVGV